MATTKPPETPSHTKQNSNTCSYTQKQVSADILTPKNRPQKAEKHYSSPSLTDKYSHITTITPQSTCNSSRFIFTTTLQITYIYLS